MHRSLYYFAMAAQAVAFALPAVFAWRGWNRRKGIAAGWAIIVIAVQTTTVLAFLNPRAFGLTKDEVGMPDAPDILPTALIAVFVSAIAFGVGRLARYAIKRI